MNPGLRSALVACSLLVPVLPGTGLAQDTPSLSTDDVIFNTDTVTAQQAAAAKAAAATPTTAAPKTAKAVREGFTLVATTTGYSFERPTAWAAVENLEASGTPDFFTYDAIFQDPKTGAVISAVSVDRAAGSSQMDVAKPESLNPLLASMLNPANRKDGVKIVRQQSGTTDDGAAWLRLKAEGNGQSVAGSVVETTFWIQFVQTESRLALVAVGYPTAQADAVALPAFHTVRSLEMKNAGGSADAAAGEGDAAKPGTAGGTPPRKKERAGGVRKQ